MSVFFRAARPLPGKNAAKQQSRHGAVDSPARRRYTGYVPPVGGLAKRRISAMKIWMRALALALALLMGSAAPVSYTHLANA